MCVETLLILHLHSLWLFLNCQGINGVLQRHPALLGCNYFHRRFCTAFGGALWVIIINRMKLLLSEHVSKVIWFPLFVYSVACGIKWYPVDLQAGSSCKSVRFAELGCTCGKLNRDVADKEQFHRARNRLQLHGTLLCLLAEDGAPCCCGIAQTWVWFCPTDTLHLHTSFWKYAAS